MMRTRYLALAGLTLSFGVATMTAQPASAGCLTGAVVGGVAGHMVHHGVLGAAAGCAVGHHHAKVAQQRQREATPTAGTPATGGAPDTATH
ncbi:hypothetical protein [Acidisphaera rubrifaciens]|uniref:Glycine zipper 2TM domain-containing protein n=1 Tax=Acidisphaera rubrifaciens HS-AP3 TaxID=1231350 RepID=A0A0D6P2N1_9PROT|nr:hypothetical protein [Acidisphaera rubrifaciens]GAN76025.1 hypothetical protein Asru_0045_16 [Acidisphaera rubrifaciens HS-AP3]